MSNSFSTPWTIQSMEFSRPQYWSLSLLQEIFPTHGSNPGLLHCRQILYQVIHKGYWSGQPIPSPGNLPDPGIEPGSPALQVHSLPAELSGKQCKMIIQNVCLLSNDLERYNRMFYGISGVLFIVILQDIHRQLYTNLRTNVEIILLQQKISH